MRLTTNFFVTRHLPTLAEIALHLSGKFPEGELKAGQELELRNMLNLDAFELVDELPPGKHAYDMVWVDEWRGDRVRSRLCVRQFKAEGLRDDLFAGTPDTFFILQGFRITRCQHQCCIYARSNRRGNVCESAFRYQEFKVLATHGSSEWNEEKHHSTGRRTSAMCAEPPLGGKAGRRHPCDCGCRLGWRPQRQGAPRLVECWPSARASQFDIGL